MANFTPAKPLSALTPGSTAIVSSLHLPEDVRRHMQSLGLIPGTKVTCLRKKRKSLSAYEIRGAVIAIREQNASLILVKPDSISDSYPAS